MQIIYKKVNEIIPYENNPRKNEEAVDYVAKSIKEFGFKVPIIIDKNNVVVAGHTRLLASKKLDLKEVPVIIADDLTEDQIKAFRLADNKVGENSKWDYELLTDELNNILNINMHDFGFLDNDKDIEWDNSIIEDNEKNQSKDEIYYECPNCHQKISEKEIICN